MYILCETFHRAQSSMQQQIQQKQYDENNGIMWRQMVDAASLMLATQFRYHIHLYAHHSIG